MTTQFSFEAISSDGRKLTGELEADDARSVADQLHRAGNYPVDIWETQARKKNWSTTVSVSSNLRLSHGQITTFMRELGMLVGAGLPLAMALKTVSSDNRSSKTIKVARSIESALEDGKTFHEALSSHPHLFDQFTVNMVRVGEASGTLATVLGRIADAREREQKIRSSLVSALLYPTFLVLIAIIAVIIMLGVVVPRFKALIVNARVEIPAETRFIIAASDWLSANAVALTIFAAAALILLLVLLRSSIVRRYLNACLLGLPVVGHLMRLNLTTRFFRGLGTLLNCGVELPRALTLLRDLFQGQKLGTAVNLSYETLRKGHDFTEPLEQSGLFQPVAISMLKVGQETGNLADASHRVADIIEDRFDVSVQRTFTILEPLIILLVSLFVAAIVVSIIGAVISVNDLIV